MAIRKWSRGDWCGFGFMVVLAGFAIFGFWCATYDLRNHCFGEADVVQGVIESIQPTEKGYFVQFSDKRCLSLKSFNTDRTSPDFRLGYETKIYLDPGSRTIRKVEILGTPEIQLKGL